MNQIKIAAVVATLFCFALPVRNAMAQVTWAEAFEEMKSARATMKLALERRKDWSDAISTVQTNYLTQVSRIILNLNQFTLQELTDFAGIMVQYNTEATSASNLTKQGNVDYVLATGHLILGHGAMLLGPAGAANAKSQFTAAITDASAGYTKWGSGGAGGHVITMSSKVDSLKTAIDNALM